MKRIESTKFSTTQFQHNIHEYIEHEVKFRAMEQYIKDKSYDDGRNRFRKKTKDQPYPALCTIRHFWDSKKELSPGHANMLDVMFQEQYLDHCQNKLGADVEKELAEIYLEVTDLVYDQVMMVRAA